MIMWRIMRSCCEMTLNVCEQGSASPWWQRQESSHHRCSATGLSCIPGVAMMLGLVSLGILLRMMLCVQRTWTGNISSSVPVSGCESSKGLRGGEGDQGQRVHPCRGLRIVSYSATAVTTVEQSQRGTGYSDRNVQGTAGMVY